jgi:hypothetical protein
MFVILLTQNLEEVTKKNMWKPGHVAMLVYKQVQIGLLREHSNSFKITAANFRGRAE